MGHGRTKRQRSRKPTVPDKEAETIITNLYKYLHSMGWKNETGLVCREFVDTGRGLCSKKSSAVRDDDSLLIKLPLEALITLCTLENDTKFKELFPSAGSASNDMGFQALMSIYLLFLKHNSESPIKAYLDSIPSKFTNPSFCKRNEYYFFPTNILLKTVEKSKMIRASYSYFQTLFGKVECECCSLPYFPTIFTIDAFEWAMYAVNSRSVFLDSREINSSVRNSFFKKYLKDQPQLALAPFLDLFNHTDKPITNVHISTVPKTKSKFYELHTTEAYKPYQQVFISYGNQSNAKLLVEYGFYLPQNQNDCFEIVLSDIEELIKSEKSLKTLVVHRKIFQFIRDHNLDDQMFFHSSDGMSHNLKVVLYLIFKETSHFPNILNQVAFGSENVFEGAVDDEARLLVSHKIRDYETFQRGLEKLDMELSDSGRVVLGYIVESLRYLNECSQAI